MRKFAIFAVVVAAALAATLASGQWLETTIQLPDSSGPIALCLDPVTRKVYSANFLAGTVTVIDAQSCSILASIRVGYRPSALVCYPAAGKVYCANTGESVPPDSTVSVIDCVGDSVIREVRVMRGPCALAVNLTNDKVYAVNFCSDYVSVISATTDSVLVNVYCGNAPMAVCHNPVVNKVYCASGIHYVTVLDGASNRTLAVIDILGGWRFCVDTIHNKVYCATAGGQVGIIDGRTDSLRALLGNASWVYDLCWAQPNGMVYAVTYDCDSLIGIDCSTDSVVFSIYVGEYPRAVCYNAINNRVYCANGGSLSVSVVDCSPLRVVREITVGELPRALAWDPATNRTFVANYLSSSISVLRDSAGGVEESKKGEVRSDEAATVVRGVLYVGLGTRSDLPGRKSVMSRAVLLDASGRRVMELQAGPNDVGHLAPGVYFVRSEPPAVSCQPSAVSKVVITGTR